MRKENEVVVILELVAKGERVGLLELILYIANVSWVKVHVFGLIACANCKVIEVVLNVEAFAMPLHAVTL